MSLRKSILLIAALLICNFSFAADLEKVSVQLKWRHGFQFAGFYAALEKGFYEQEGLDVELIEYYPGKGNKYFTKAVADGSAQYGVAGANLLLSYYKGEPVVLLSQIFQHSPLILLSTKDKGIESPYDLYNRTISYNTGSAGGVPVRFMLQQTLGGKLKDVKNKPNIYDPEKLIKGEVDAIVAYLTDEPFYLIERGYEPAIIKPQSYGIDFYGDNLFTNKTELQNHPERVRKMINATLKGWRYALDNTNEIINIIIKKYNSGKMSRAHLQYEAEYTSKMILKDFIELGSVDKNRISSMLSVYRDLGYIANTDIPSDFYYAIDSEIDLTAKEKEWIRANPEINMSMPMDIPPYVVTEPTGKFGGIIPDYLRVIEKKSGIKFNLVSLPFYWKNADDIDVKAHGVIIENNTSKGIVDHTTPYKTTALSIFTRKDITPAIHSEKDLSGKSVAVIESHKAAQEYINNINGVIIVPAKDTREQIEMLQHGKVDAILGYESYSFIFNKDLIQDIKLAFSDNRRLPVSIGVVKGNPELLSILNKAMANTTPQERSDIRNKWAFNINTPNSHSGDFFSRLSNNEKNFLSTLSDVKMCIDPDWMPFEKNDNGKHIGMTADYISILKEITGINIVMVNTDSWVQSLEYGKARKCDIFSLVMPTPERKEYIDFTSPYLSIPLVIATSMDQIFIDKIDKVTDKLIGVPQGYAYAEILRAKYPEMKLVDVKGVNDGLEKVHSGELFGFVGTLATVGYNIQNRYLSELKIAGKFDQTWELGIGTRNDMPLLKSVFDKAIASIPADKQQEVLNKWISVKYEKGVDYSLIWKISLAAVLITLLLIYRNSRIKKINSQLKNAHKELENMNRLIREKSAELEAQQMMVDQHVIISTTDTNGIITNVNEAFCKISCYSKDEVIGKKHKIVNSSNTPSAVFEDMWNNISKGKDWQGEIENITKDGKPYHVSINIGPIKDSDGNITGYRSIQEDITDKKRIEELSVTDALTGIYNRMKLDEVLNVKLYEFDRYSTPFSVILMDVDDFKEINDTYGHDAGDYVLKEISKLLKENIRVADIAGRWGGEEFVIICSNTPLKGAADFAEKIRQIISEHDMGRLGNKTVSIGVAECQSGDNVSSLFKSADSRLYKAKTTGKDRVVSED